MSVTTIDSSPSQDYTHPDDQTTPSNSTPGLKPFTLSDCYVKGGNTRYKNPQLVAQHEQICCVTSCEFDEKRATKPKFVSQSRLYYKFLQSVTNVFVARQVDHAW